MGADLYSFGVLVWVVLTGGVLECKGTSLPPVPPCGECKDASGLLNNWLLLQKCIEDPANNDANPVPIPAKDLILRLTDREDFSKPFRDVHSLGLSHQSIREHPFF